jgi:Fic family protein
MAPSERNRRPYEESHSWINFTVDLDRAAPSFWLLLGEAKSKCEHIARVPTKHEIGRQLHLVYFAKGVNATTAIEGNTLSEEEVLRRMEGQLKLPPSKEYLGVEIDNMLAAYNDILRRVLEGEDIPLTVDTCKHLNKRILEGLEVEYGVVPGEFRTGSVAVGPYIGAPAGDVEFLLERMCEWLNSPAFIPSTDAQRIPMAFIRAVLAHLYIEWIHPFGDGNGRLGRLVEFLVLVSSGVPSSAAHVLTSHYMQTRTEYYRHLHQASRDRENGVRALLHYAAQGFVDGLADQLALLFLQVEELMWESLVDEEFRSKRPSEASRRQRQLAVELGRDYIKTRTSRRRAELRRLTPDLQDAYAGTAKMLTRDINVLRDLGLVATMRPNFVVPAVGKLHALRPGRRDTEMPELDD